MGSFCFNFLHPSTLMHQNGGHATNDRHQDQIPGKNFCLYILNSTALAASRIFCLGVKTIFGVFSAFATVTSSGVSIIVSSALTRVSDTVRHGYLILFVKGHCDCSVRLPLASYTNT